MQVIQAPIKPGASGLEVVNLQDALLLLLSKTAFITDDAALKEKLAFSLTDERASQAFGDGGTLMSVKLFQAQRQLEVTGEVDTPTADALNTVLRDLGALDPDVPRSVVVSGQITWQDDSPAIGVTVTAFDCDMNNEQKIGTATTRDEGRYEIRDRIERIRRTRKKSADVRIDVAFDTAQKPFSSDIYHKVTAEKTIDLKLPMLAPNTPSELDGLLSTLEPLLDGVLLAALNARHIDFLVNQTGIERTRIEWASLAARSARDMADAPAIPLAVFYAWFRLDTEPDALWATPTETLLTSLRTAIAQNIVPSSIGADVVTLGAAIEHIKLDRVLLAPALGTAANLGDLLATLPERLNKDQQRAIAAAVTELRPDDPKLVERIAEIPGFGGSANVAIGVARTLRLGALTGGHVALTQALQLHPQLADDPDGKLLALAALPLHEWLDMAYTYGLPDELDMTPVDYANMLAARVEQQFPTATLRAHLTDGRRLAQQPLLTDVGTFLSANPDFDIVNANLNLLSEQLIQDGVTELNQLIEGLRRLQHMHVLEVPWAEAAILLENGLHSPQKLLDAGRGQLTARLEGQLTPERVIELHARAEDLQSTTFAAYTAAFWPLTGPPIPGGGFTDPKDPGRVGMPVDVPLLGTRGVVPHGLPPAGAVEVWVDPRDPGPKLPDSIKKAIAHQPTLQALFGAQDACVCGHCNSVLSPAAYFVDVLQFLKNADMLGERQGYAGLLSRRPDLQDIELSCNNTNTEVPAIDLALEILENAVALHQLIDVPLPPGTDMSQQLINGEPVGDLVKQALQTTVRSLLGEVRATVAGSQDWTVVDGHRRWSLIVRNKGIRAVREAGAIQQMDLAGLPLSVWIAALDQGLVASGGEAAFAKLFAPTNVTPPDLTNYTRLIIAQAGAGGQSQAWLVEYRMSVQLRLSLSSLILETTEGVIWWKKEFTQATLLAVSLELADRKVPALIQEPLTLRFGPMPDVTITLVDTNKWMIGSSKLELTLHFTPAQLSIASLTYQSGDPDADAIAEPENHNPAAYVRLKGDPEHGIPTPSFPWSLPVDLPLEEVRLFLDRARSSRRRLIEFMRPVGQVSGDDIVFIHEVLGLSAAEAQIIAPTTPALAAKIYGHWGLTATRTRIWDAAAGQDYVAADALTLTLLKNVSILLQQSRLSFEELQAVIATEFVTDKGKAPLPMKPAGTCIPSEMRLPDLTVPHLDRIHCFVRLQRRIKWSPLELDRAIMLITGADIHADINAKTLQGLAQLVCLCEVLGLPIEKIVELLQGTTPLKDWARALELSSGALDHALKLFGIAIPFASPAATLEFCERVKAFGRAGITFEDLRYLFQHVETPGSNVDLDAKQLAQLVRAARAATNSIPAAPTEPALPSGSDPDSVARALALHRAREATREDAVIAALATGLGAVRELVDDLLRIQLRHPSDPISAAIEVLSRSALFSVDDLVEVRSLIRQLQNGATPITQYLMSRFSAQQRKVLTNTSSTQQALQDTLIAALNEVVQGASIYEAGRFAGVTLSAETLALESQKPIGATLAWLNRQLLEDSFPADIRPTSAPIKTILVRLHKSVFLCNALKLGPTDLKLLRQPTLTIDANGLAEIDVGLTALQFNALPDTLVMTSAPADIERFNHLLETFEQLLALAHLRDIAPRAGDLLHQLAALDPADTYVQKAGQALAVGLLGSDTLENVEQVNQASAQLGIVTVDQYRDPVALTRLIDLLVALQQLGATVAQAVPLAAASPNDTAALSARALLRSKYSDSSWHDLIKPIADKLRERQRDALVEYLIANDNVRDDGERDPRIVAPPHLRDVNDLYEYYLIDIQTSSCMKTTRLLQATAAAQLFVQRLLLNLEGHMALSDDKRQLWDWMHRYRLWEANRKVFLFPENWLLPELRDDKTATFRQMESALTEQEPSPEITRAALLGYLEELGDLAQISVIAMYQDQRNVGKDKQNHDIVKHTLYIVGRTPDTPYRYFWRSCSEFGSDQMIWSGWEALDLDNANDFLMPFVFEGDLHIAWPIFRKAKEETKEETDSVQLWWDVQIAWTRRTNKGWVKRKIGNVQLEHVRRLENKEAADSFFFRLSKDVSRVSILGSPLLSREQINIFCYAAKEIGEIAYIVAPNPLVRNEITHTGTLPTGRNVSLSVKGLVYESATVGPHSHKYRAVSGMKVWISGNVSTTDTTWAPFWHERYTVDGVFTFDDLSVFHGMEVTLTFWWSNTTPDVVKVIPVDPNDGRDNYPTWFWDLNVTRINNEIAKEFSPSRPVKFEPAGSFIIESGRDIRPGPLVNPLEALIPRPYRGYNNIARLDMPVDGNRFSETNNTIDNIYFGPAEHHGVDEGQLSPSPVVKLPFMINRASQKSPALGRPIDLYAWYLQDKDGGFYFKKNAISGKWDRWPDGQPYASSYRVDAALSTSVLFQPDFQTQLHFDPDGNTFNRKLPYANYNWELFLHAPLAVADYLAGQQRFEEARRWLHAVFDPTTDKKDKYNIPQFWRFLPFVNAKQPDAIATLLTWLADPKTGDPKVEADLSHQIAEWKENPFMPHLIARLRPSAYQWHTFFAYLDVLIGWGDQLFRRDTRESVNEATLLYILAAKLLGPRPRVIPALTPPPPQTYRSLPKDKDGDLAGFSNAWLTWFDLAGIKKLSASQPAATARSSSAAQKMVTVDTGTALEKVKNPPKTLLTSLSALAFCIPQNEKVTEFYDRIEQRLFNVRNCRNIDGVFRNLPLYEPPIDPLLLIRARAAGLDINSAIDGLDAPLPHYRFNFTLQKALELAAELKALGGALLSALEKQDAEVLTLLRSGHEIAMLKLVSDTREQQKAEAEANIVALQQSEATILERFGQYQKLLGKPSITKGQDGLPVVEQSSSLTVSTDPVGGVSGMGLSRMEVAQLMLTAVAHVHTQVASSGHIVAGVLSLIPNIWAGGVFAGQTFGGSQLGGAATAIAKSIEMVAAEANYLAAQMGTFGGYERRQDEWVHQSKLALAELKQIKKQIIAAEIRREIADLELKNHEKQIENAEKVDEFMRGKFTNKQLYGWMSSQIAEVYFRTYQLAIEQAKRAERSYQFELGLDATTAAFVGTGYWDSLKKGLMAGDRLYHDLKRMEVTYLNQNKREFELTKHISLALLSPLALVTLRETGRCTIKFPEEIFDLDYPGHYFRRIKSVSITLPCVAGPYTTISCTLRLTKNSIRIKTTNGTDGYRRNTAANIEDSRFVENHIPVTAIAASGGQNDSGVFELSFRDERYLPFEGAGVVSEWSLELFNDSDPSYSDFGKPLRQFDYKTISDAILHVKYTAREDAGLFKNRTVKHLRDYFEQAGKTPSLRMFNLRQEFPTQWHRFLHPTAPADPNVFELAMSPNLFRLIDGGKTLKVNTMWLLARCTNEESYEVVMTSPLPAPPTPSIVDPIKMTLDPDDDYGGLHVSQKGDSANPLGIIVALTDPPVKWQLRMMHVGGENLKEDITKKVMEVEDLIVVLGYEWE